MQHYRLLEAELRYVRPQAIEKQLEWARLIREGRIERPGFHERALLRLGDFLISLGVGLKARYVPFASDPSVDWPMDGLPSGT